MSGVGCVRLSGRLPALRLALALLGGVLLAACSGGGSGDGDGGAAASETGAAPTATNVPVSVATVRHEMLNVIVTAPGRTEALRRDRVRAPFASRLMSLRVTDGDHVAKGQIIAVVVSKNSEAALDGAEQMLAAARSPDDRADAQRAVDVARRNLVQQTLRAPADGVVLSHAAEAGDYVDVNEVLVTIAETDTVYFNAQVAQSDVGRVRSGQHASIDIPAVGTQAVTAVVQGLLPMASSQNFSAPVRLDFSPPRRHMPLGLFGTASIVVAQHMDATVVPASAVLRDDVTGVTRVAIVESSGAAHWLTVEAGVREGGRVEIVKPPIAAGMHVITDGQVGLPEGAKVVVQQ